jgi:hypothetical protein
VYREIWWENLRKICHLEDLGVFRIWMARMGWIDLSQNRDRWSVLVNAVINTSSVKFRAVLD